MSVLCPHNKRSIESIRPAQLWVPVLTYRSLYWLTACTGTCQWLLAHLTRPAPHLSLLALIHPLTQLHTNTKLHTMEHTHSANIIKGMDRGVMIHSHCPLSKPAVCRSIAESKKRELHKINSLNMPRRHENIYETLCLQTWRYKWKQ